MAKNKISDLRDHLFAALERIDDDTLSPEQIKAEVDKAKAISAIGSVIINSAKIEVDFIKATGRIDSASELFKSIDNEHKRIA
jgi:hypothetical protein